MDILECEVCEEEFSVNLDIVEAHIGYYCPYCGHREDWE